MVILRHQHIYYKGAPQEHIKHYIGAHKSIMSLTRIDPTGKDNIIPSNHQNYIQGEIVFRILL